MLIYVAVPYSHNDAAVMEQRFLAANAFSAKLMGAGHHVFSPISHGHPISKAGQLPTDWEYWKAFCRKMLSACDSIAVLKLPGWSISVGVQNELEIAEELGLPVEFYDELGGPSH